MGLALFVLTVVSFSSWVTCHTVLCARLMGLSFARGLSALLIFPLAPWYAAPFPITRRVWVILLLLYGISLAASFVVTG